MLRVIMYCYFAIQLHASLTTSLFILDTSLTNASYVFEFGWLSTLWSFHLVYFFFVEVLESSTSLFQ